MTENTESSQPEEAVKKLYRSRNNKIIGGVCGGIAEYFDVEPLLVRIVWLILFFFGGVGLLAYLVALIIIPVNRFQTENGAVQNTRHDKAMLWGSILIILGTVLLFRHYDIWYYLRFWDIPWQVVWAAFLIIFGVFLVYNRYSGSQSYETAGDADESRSRQFYRDPRNKMVGGVCSGLASFFDVDVTLVRLGWVVITLASIGIGVIAYLIMVIVFPEIPEGNRNEAD